MGTSGYITNTQADCGVACLLYAKVGSGQSGWIGDDQSVTWYRSLLDRTLANTVLKVATQGMIR